MDLLRKMVFNFFPYKKIMGKSFCNKIWKDSQNASEIWFFKFSFYQITLLDVLTCLLNIPGGPKKFTHLNNMKF